MSDVDICPKCGSKNLDLKGCGAYQYGRYEHYEWICEDCKYSEEQYIYDSTPEMQINEEEKNDDSN